MLLHAVADYISFFYRRHKRYIYEKTADGRDSARATRSRYRLGNTTEPRTGLHRGRTALHIGH